MYKIVCCFLIALIASTYAYTNNGGYSSYGQSQGGGQTLSFGNYGGGSADAGSSQLGGQEYSQPQVIEVSPDQLPVQVHFRTASSRMNVAQSHGGQPMQPQIEHASFQDEPHRVVHEVVKPVIQEVREIIQPYRRVTQEIRPVIEEVHTVVHKGDGRGKAGGGLGGGAGLGGKSYGGNQQYKSRAARA